MTREVQILIFSVHAFSSAQFRDCLHYTAVCSVMLCSQTVGIKRQKLLFVRIANNNYVACSLLTMLIYIVHHLHNY